MKKILLTLFIVSLAVITGCGGTDDTITNTVINATFTLTANGAEGAELTTELYLTFNRSIDGFSINDITVTGIGALEGKVVKGAFNYDAALGCYKLEISGLNVDGKVMVEVTKDGYRFTPDSAIVDVYFYDDEAIQIEFENLTADGDQFTTTTEINLFFEGDNDDIDDFIDAFTIDDITVTGTGHLIDVDIVDVIEKGADYITLEITGVVRNGVVTVQLIKDGYMFIPSLRTINVFYFNPNAEPVEFSALTANGGNFVTTTALTLTFDKEVEGLTAADIELNVEGTAQVTKGALTTDDDKVYTLAVTVTKGGFLTVTLDNPDFAFTPALSYQYTQVYVAGEYLSFVPPVHDPFMWGGAHPGFEAGVWPFLNTAAGQEDWGFDVTERALWAQHAKCNLIYGFRSTGLYNSVTHVHDYLNWNLIDPDNASNVYTARVTYEMKITEPDLVDDFINFKFYLAWNNAAAQVEIDVENFGGVKAELKANAESGSDAYTTMTYIVPSVGVGSPLSFMYFLFGVATTDNIAGKVFIRDFRFYKD